MLEAALSWMDIDMTTESMEDLVCRIANVQNTQQQQKLLEKSLQQQAEEAVLRARIRRLLRNAKGFECHEMVRLEVREGQFSGGWEPVGFIRAGIAYHGTRSKESKEEIGITSTA